MTVCHLVLVAAALSFPAGAAPSAEIETLKGERRAGELVSLEASAAVLKTGDSSATIPLSEVLELRFPASPPPEPSTGPRVLLADGTRLTLSSFSVADEKARCETSFGTFTLPVARLAHVRFGISTAKLDDAWNALL